MKRRIVRITAGALIVFAWLAAGVYAFWGGKKGGDAEPAVNAQEMSQQIAAANEGKELTNPVKPAVAVEDAPAAPVKPQADALFSASKSNAFKPRAGAFQPSTTAPETTSPAASAYGAPTTPEVSIPLGSSTPADTGNANPEPTPDANTFSGAATEEDAPSAYTPNPLRGAPRTFSAATEEASMDAAADEGALANTNAGGSEPPLSPPPAQLDAEMTEDAPTPAVPTPAAPPSSFGGSRFGDSRFGAPPPANALPSAPTADAAIPETSVAVETAAPEASGYGAPAARRIGGAGYGVGQESNAPSALNARSMPPASAGVASADVSDGSIASARPGQQAWEGAQAPSLVIEKHAPAEVQVGKAARFEIHVRNAGQTAAQNVIVTDQIPAGTQLVEAKPTPAQGADGSLVWELGKLEPGQDRSIVLELMPQQEGEIGSVAQVTFAAAASVKTVSTKPQLTVEHIAPAKVMIGESVTLQITISNPGTGVATNVVLQEDVPEGLAHSAGKELEYEVGTLRPGESRKLELQLEAAKAGVVQNTLMVRGDANLLATHTSTIEVLAPQLEVAMSGPKRRYLDRQATYTVSIANPGTAAARDVEIVAYLPKGMKFVSTDREGQYDPQNHAVYWSLEELPPAQQGSAQLITIPVEPGEQKLRVEGHAQLSLKTSDEETVVVEAIPQLAFEIIDEADPIEVGADTIYQIRVTNEGSKAASNVQVAAALPPELRPVNAEGATRGGVEGQTVVFEPIAKLAPQAEAVFKIQATGLRTGHYNIRVQVTSDDLQTPVTKEEPTRVYADR